MLRFCKEILQYFQYSIHSKDWLLVEETSTGQNHNNYLIWYLKEFKDLILKFLASGSFFLEKEFGTFYT